MALLWACTCLSGVSSSSISLVASFSQRGVRGEVRFSQEDGQSVQVTADLAVGEGRGGEYTWGIYHFPIDYTKKDYCEVKHTGRRPRVDLSDLGGALVLPSAEPVILTLDQVNLLGQESIWGSSLVLQSPGRERICATILPDVEKQYVKVAEARFTSPVAGSVFFHTLTIGDITETKIFSNLFHVVEGATSSLPWQIYITDILGSNKRRQTCNFLQILYDPDNKDSQSCSPSSPQDCKQGDLTSKFGPIPVGKKQSMFTTKYFTDSTLHLPELEGSRSLYLTLFDPEHTDSFLACAQIHHLETKVARAMFSHDGITGHVGFTQTSPFHPVQTDIALLGLHDGAGSFHIHEYPVPGRLQLEDAPCGQTGQHFNPFGVDMSNSPPNGAGSSDQYEVGDLSGKYGDLTNRTDVSGSFVDPSLSLFGPLSVVGRSVVIHKSPIPHRWVCANIELQGAREIRTAVATFTYPVGGNIVFQQDVANPLADTSIYVEGLVYTDGTRNNTDSHPWHVHNDIPGKDFFNWTGRCVSAGDHYNPYDISREDGIYRCNREEGQARCEVGDLQHKHSLLSVAGETKDLARKKAFFTDSNLPLTGPASIVGRSLVIHDDKAPEHRGNRMACTAIRRQYRHKAVANQWFGNGIPPPVEGRLEFVQDNLLTTTHTLVDLRGLDSMVHTYHVHEIPVQPMFEFPCTGEAVGGHFNPWEVDGSLSPVSGGTPDQFEVGDLSGKYGNLDGLNSVKRVYNDTSLPMFGLHSIIGRSIVLHKDRGKRWACSTIGWGWDPDEAKQVTAIASFHHPNGFAWGYIRFAQVVYSDGSSTDTIITVRLKHPGKTNRMQTYGHDWEVWVNPVGIDATIKHQAARCTAGGYRWNPTFIQLADPQNHGLYSQQCSPRVPLRCEVGDLSGRHGKISIGSNAFVFNDQNLPLFGDWFHTALGKSVIVKDENGLPLSCATIEPDKDIIKYAVIKTLSGFNLGVFMEEVQSVMAVPDWFLFTDSRETKILHEGRCLQILLHFRGPHANKLEQDFSRLLRTGKLDSPSINPPGYIRPKDLPTKLPYRECGSDKKKLHGLGSNFSSSSSPVLSLLLLILVSLEHL